MITRWVAADDMRRTAEGPVLIGGRCADCAAVSFPRASSCARCTGILIKEHELARRGTLWTFTTQEFRPKLPYNGPEEFTPFGLGYVDLGGEVLVESRLTLADIDRLTIGMPVELGTEVYTHDADGTPVETFAFAPIEQELS
ncbi:OB-fold domain-containing protein [Aeromicrobium sp.]|uniref:Zn-ribbon domain-containing OB-fold protein n=1 Tax=Aeromicrobium sp. TaxID=1871063 RepID=UPI0019B14EF7|nr:OB-fold domain-containing protein [Aeromicrobium sp.]MBC7630714.1 OB-fold domain-containing protein [Aeromicrobium sp.]